MKNSENKTILDYETVDFNKEENCLVIIDQTLLPGKTEIIDSLWPTFWETRAAIGTAETPAEPIRGFT